MLDFFLMQWLFISAAITILSIKCVVVAQFVGYHFPEQVRNFTAI
jgi:hypothetical protein